jgi:hypothetical protein
MHTLDQYLASEGAKSLTALSAAVGISKGRLSQLRNAKDWPPELALHVERETDGRLDASCLSPVVALARKGRAA